MNTGEHVGGATEAAARIEFEPFMEETKPFALAGIRAGNGEPVVLLSHPPFPAAVVYGDVLGHLARRYRVVAVDFPATAGSPAAEKPLFAVGFTLALDDLCRRLRIEPALLAGAGLSSAVVADYAVTHGETVRRVALLDPFVPGFHARLPPPEASLVSALAPLRLSLSRRRLARRLSAPLPDGAALETLRDRRRRESYFEILRVLRPPRRAHELRASVLHYCHLRAALLLVCGNLSPLARPAPLAMILRRMTDARVLALRGVERFPAVEAPEATGPALSDFFAGLWPVQPGLPPLVHHGRDAWDEAWQTDDPD